MRATNPIAAKKTKQLAPNRQSQRTKDKTKVLPNICKTPKAEEASAMVERNPDEVAIQPLAGEREEGESDRAVHGCCDYLRMGPGRSLRKLIDQYSKTHHDTPDYEPPTLSLDTLKKWSTYYKWPERSLLYDYEWEQKRTAIAHAAMKSGLALPHVRMQEINELYWLLKEELMELGLNANNDEILHNLWIPDVKSIGSGESAERVDLEKYNSALINDLRGLLDDAAKESGGRRPKDETETFLKMLVAKVGLHRLPAEFLDRVLAGENPWSIMFDIINNLKVPDTIPVPVPAKTRR